MSNPPVGSILEIAAAMDFATLADLHGLCMDPPWSRADIDGLFASSDAQGWIARRPVRAEGFALCRRIRDEGELLAIGVLPRARRAGVAGALLQAVLAHMEHGGVRALFLEVAEDNEAARAFYGAAGFTVVGRRPAYYRRGAAPSVAALTMRLEIRPS